VIRNGHPFFVFLYIFGNGPLHIRDIIGQQQTQSPSLKMGLLSLSILLYLTYHHYNQFELFGQLLIRLMKSQKIHLFRWQVGPIDIKKGPQYSDLHRRDEPRRIATPPARLYGMVMVS